MRLVIKHTSDKAMAEKPENNNMLGQALSNTSTILLGLDLEFLYFQGCREYVMLPPSDFEVPLNGIRGALASGMYERRAPYRKNDLMIGNVMHVRKGINIIESSSTARPNEKVRILSPEFGML